MVLSVCGLILLINLSYGQDRPPQIIPPSPNAASIGIYGQIPVSIFNGLPQIAIPIGKTSTGDLDMDVSIGYHGGGIRPDQHGSWVGLGWNLNAGGTITRKVNGGVDEVQISTDPNPTKYSYYNNYGTLSNESTWFSEATLRQFASVSNLKAIPSPDEFTFGFGGYSGSFYLNHEGKWQVKSEQSLTLEIVEELVNDYVLDKSSQTHGTAITLKRIFYKFTLTTPDGNKYIFGGTPESIEFTRSAVGHNSDYNEVIPTSWSLTKVITNKGREVNFKYERGGVLGMLSSNYSLFSYQRNTAYRSGGSHTASLSVVNPVYLKQIETANQKIVFERSLSNEMPYVYMIKASQAQLVDMASYMIYLIGGWLQM